MRLVRATVDGKLQDSGGPCKRSRIEPKAAAGHLKRLRSSHCPPWGCERAICRLDGGSAAHTS